MNQYKHNTTSIIFEVIKERKEQVTMRAVEVGSSVTFTVGQLYICSKKELSTSFKPA